MTNDEKKAWLLNYLSNCLGEELPPVQGEYTFGEYTLNKDEVLREPPQLVDRGRTIFTINIDTFLKVCEKIEVLTKENFAITCLNDPMLKDWYQWNLSRGRIPL